MAQFLLEFYVSRGDGAAIRREEVNARRAAHELSREGTPVRWLRSIFVPDDETCFFLFEAASAEVVRATALRAALPFERVSEAYVNVGR